MAFLADDAGNPINVTGINFTSMNPAGVVHGQSLAEKAQQVANDLVVQQKIDLQKKLLNDYFGLYVKVGVVVGWLLLIIVAILVSKREPVWLFSIRDKNVSLADVLGFLVAAYPFIILIGLGLLLWLNGV